jgi:predicted RND superfamily exporter protein
VLTTLDRTLNWALAEWVGQVQRHARLILALTLVACIASAVYVKDHLGVNSDQEAMLSPDLPYRRLQRDFYAAFPQLERPLTVLVDAETPERASGAIR